MKTDDVRDAIRRARREIFRLEVQQSYAGVADPGWEAWQEGGGLVPLTPEIQKWYDAITARVRAGVLQHRVLVVDEPLNPYLQYEFAAFQRNVEAGERVLVARRAEHPDLAALTEDFWMVDEQFVAIMNYDREHRPLDPTEPANPVSAYRAQRDLALSHAVPLDRWMKEHPELLAG
jgi:hypothetical protein